MSGSSAPMVLRELKTNGLKLVASNCRDHFDAALSWVFFISVMGNINKDIVYQIIQQHLELWEVGK